MQANSFIFKLKRDQKTKRIIKSKLPLQVVVCTYIFLQLIPYIFRYFLLVSANLST